MFDGRVVCPDQMTHPSVSNPHCLSSLSPRRSTDDTRVALQCVRRRRQRGAMRSRPRMTSCRMRSRLASGSAKAHSPPSPGPSVALPTPTAPSGSRMQRRNAAQRNIIDHSRARMVRCNARDEAPHHDQHAPPGHHRHAGQRDRARRFLHLLCHGTCYVLYVRGVVGRHAA